jgi:tetratricopeptide (TPR) repeat protein
VIGEDEPSADLAFLLMRLGRAHAMAGSPDKGAEWNERGLGLAETLELPEQLVLGWDTKAVLVSERHPAEARSLFQLALDTALASELYDAASRACAGLSELAFRDDRYGDSLAHLDQAHQLALRIGNRGLEWFSVSEATYALTMLGRWDEALARLADIPDDLIGKDSSLAGPLSGVLELLLYRGRIEEARELLARYDDLYARSAGDVQTQGAYRAALAGVRLAEGKPEDAMAAAEQVFAARETLGIGSQNVKLGFLHALEAALALGETAKTRELLDALEALPRGLRPPLLEAVALRFRAQLEPGDPGADPLFIEAAMEFRALGLPFHLAVVELEHAEWLTRQGRAADAEPLFADARETFARLGATPWIDRVDRAVGAPASPSRKAASREA